MNKFHEVNRANWDGHAAAYKLRVDEQNIWNRCHLDPTVALSPSEIEALGDLKGKRACALGSGNNCAVFALAGMGASVTSVDISYNQLRNAKTRAGILGLCITFVTADVTDLSLGPETFDVIHTGGHVACWVSDLDRYYAEAYRIMKPGGVLVIQEYHPFFREIWSPLNERLIIERPYGERGPYLEEGNAGDPYVFTWTVSDYINAMLNAGFDLVKFEEISNSDVKDIWRNTQFNGLPDEIVLVGRKH